MDENASRAAFIGVSVFVAIITITLITSFYFKAKEEASVANRVDVSEGANTYLNKVLSKNVITGLELRYLLNYYADNEEVEISVYIPGETLSDISQLKKSTVIQKGIAYWEEENQILLDKEIKPNYNFRLIIDNTVSMKMIAMFEN